MRLVLDTNEYLLAVGPDPKPSSQKLLDLLASPDSSHRVRIPRLIINEIRRNLPPETFREVLAAIHLLTSIDEDFVVPFELGTKYEAQNLKPADAFIVAYTEFVGANALVTENRHFLTRQTDLPFRVLTAGQCLKLL